MEKKFSVKEFFKSTAFKCIYVLLAIVLVCGVLLAFCNDLFEVSDEERLARAISKIYGSNVTATDAVEDGMTLEFDNGTVNQAYAIEEDGNYLVNVTGTGGYDSGTVTLWVVIEMNDGAIDGIGKVMIESNEGQSFIDRVNSGHLEYFGDNFSSEENFTVSDWQLSSGPTVTLTATAIVNAVNTATEFVRTQLLGEVIVPDEPSPFEKFSYYSETYISDDTTVELAEDGTSVVFGIVANPYVFTSTFRMSITVDNTGTITAMTVPATPADGNGSTDGFENSMDENVLNASLYIGKTADEILDYLGGEPKDDFTYEDLKNNAVADNTITSGATYSNFIVTYAELFAASNYQNGYVMALENSVEYTQYIDMDNTTVSVADGIVTYNVVTTSYGQAQAFNIDITVNADGTIADFTITKNGSTDDTFKGYMDENILSGAMFETKNAAAILDMFKEPTGEDGEFVKNDLEDSSLASGATDSTYDNAGYSNFLCVYAALFAASNYEVYAELAQYLPPAFTYTDYIDVDNTTWDIADDESSVTFHIVTKDYTPAKAFNIDITVNADGTIADFTITKNGSTDDTFKGYMDENILSGAMFETKNAAAILDMFKEPTGEDGEFVKNDLEDSSLASGATDSTYNNAGYSNFLCVYSALFAAENYDLLISGGENA